MALSSGGDTWRISGEERTKHDSQFFSLKPVNGYITGEQARGFFMQSGLPTPVLGQIWTLADMNNDGKMDKKEFSIAMHLIKKKLQGFELPKTLPPTLKADPSPMIASGGGMAPPMGMSMVTGMPMMSGMAPTNMVTSSMTMPIMSNGSAPQMGVMGNQGIGMPVMMADTKPRTGSFGPTQPNVPVTGSFAMPHNSKLKHTQTFNTNDRHKRGHLTGVEARALLVHTGLPQPMLAQIWNLADFDKDGKLTCDEFCIAMHLADLVRVGVTLPAKLPPELYPTKGRAGSLTSTTPRTGSFTGTPPPHQPAPQQPDAFGDLLGGMGMPPPVVPQPNVTTENVVEEVHPVTFEDKRKENFDKGQAELERRRQMLQEQMKQQERVRLEKERQEQEKREHYRQEQERKRLMELERQMEKQRQIEREKEQQRQKMLEQKEAARRESERHRQMEWERQRKEQLLAEKAREYEQLGAVKSKSSNLKCELESLQGKKTEIGQKINQVRNGVTDFTSAIESMRITRDNKNAEIERLQNEIKTLDQKFAKLKQDQEFLNVKVQTTIQNNPMAETYRTVLHSVELKKTTIQKLKKELEQTERDTESRLIEIDNTNIELKNLKTKLDDIQKELVKAEKQKTEMKNRINLDQQAQREREEQEQKRKEDAARIAKLAQEASQPMKSQPAKQTTNENAWFDFGSQATTTKSDDIWSAAFSDVTVTTAGSHDIWGKTDTAATTRPSTVHPTAATRPSTDQSREKARALYQFDSRNHDELSLLPGDVVLLYADQSAAEPGWLGGEKDGKTGWFPEAYIERIDSSQTDSHSGATITDTEYSTPTQVQEIRVTSPTPGLGEKAPDGLQAQALYPWKAKKDNHLTFNKGDVIVIKEQQDMWWSGELHGQFGWFPKSYVKLIGGVATNTSQTTSRSETPVINVSEESTPQQLTLDTHNLDSARSTPHIDSARSTPHIDSARSTPSTLEPKEGEYYVAVYYYTSSEPGDLTFNQNEVILVTKTEGDWWTGSIGDRSGIFPSGYVKKMDIPQENPPSIESLLQTRVSSIALETEGIHFDEGLASNVPTTEAGPDTGFASSDLTTQAVPNTGPDTGLASSDSTMQTVPNTGHDIGLASSHSTMQAVPNTGLTSLDFSTLAVLNAGSDTGPASSDSTIPSVCTTEGGINTGFVEDPFSTPNFDLGPSEQNNETIFSQNSLDDIFTEQTIKMSDIKQTTDSVQTLSEGVGAFDDGDPMQSSSGDQIQSSNVDLFHSSNGDPFQSSSGDPFHSSTDDPFQSSTGDPFQSSTGDPFQSSNGDPFQSLTGDPLQSSTADMFQSSTGDPFQSSSSDPFQYSDSQQTNLFANFTEHDNNTGQSAQESVDLIFQSALESVDSKPMLVLGDVLTQESVTGKTPSSPDTEINNNDTVLQGENLKNKPKKSFLGLFKKSNEKKPAKAKKGKSKSDSGSLTVTEQHSPGSPTEQELQSPGSPTGKELQSPGGPTGQELQSPGSPTGKELQSPGTPTGEKLEIVGGPIAHELQNPGSQTGNNIDISITKFDVNKSTDPILNDEPVFYEELPPKPSNELQGEIYEDIFEIKEAVTKIKTNEEKLSVPPPRPPPPGKKVRFMIDDKGADKSPPLPPARRRRRSSSEETTNPGKEDMPPTLPDRNTKAKADRTSTVTKAKAKTDTKSKTKTDVKETDDKSNYDKQGDIELPVPKQRKKKKSKSIEDLTAPEEIKTKSTKKSFWPWKKRESSDISKSCENLSDTFYEEPVSVSSQSSNVGTSSLPSDLVTSSHTPDMVTGSQPSELVTGSQATDMAIGSQAYDMVTASQTSDLVTSSQSISTVSDMFYEPVGTQQSPSHFYLDLPLHPPDTDGETSQPTIDPLTAINQISGSEAFSPRLPTVENPGLPSVESQGFPLVEKPGLPSFNNSGLLNQANPGLTPTEPDGTQTYDDFLGINSLSNTSVSMTKEVQENIGMQTYDEFLGIQSADDFEPSLYDDISNVPHSTSSNVPLQYDYAKSVVTPAAKAVNSDQNDMPKDLTAEDDNMYEEVGSPLRHKLGLDTAGLDNVTNGLSRGNEMSGSDQLNLSGLARGDENSRPDELNLSGLTRGNEKSVSDELNLSGLAGSNEKSESDKLNLSGLDKTESLSGQSVNIESENDVNEKSQATQQKTGTIKKPEIASVIAAYSATGPEQLSLQPGQVIQVRKKSPSGWWEGELQARGQKKKIGWFPANYVKILGGSRSTPDNTLEGQKSGEEQHLAPSMATTTVSKSPAASPQPQTSYIEQVIAMYPYNAQHDDELTFHKDSVINVLNKDDDNWWRGEVNGQTGMFPSNYVGPLTTSPPQDNTWSSDPAVLATTSSQESKRQNYIHELINTEESYMDDMSIVMEAFYKPMSEAKVMTEEELESVFVNWQELILCNTKFSRSLRVRKKMIGKGKVIQVIGDILCENLPHMTPYIRFCSCQLKAAALIQHKTENSVEFREVQKICTQHPKTKSMPLSSFLLKPMQRITKYPLMIQKILQYTPEGHPDHQNLKEALIKAEELCSQVNEGVRERENSDKLEWMQNHVHCEGLPEKITFNSVTNCLGPRKIIFSGTIYKAKSNKELVGFLCNDFLLLTYPLSSSTTKFVFDPKARSQYKMYKTPIFLNEIMIKRIGDEDSDNCIFQVSHIDRVYNFKTGTNTDRDNWLRHLEAASNDYIETERKRRERVHSLKRSAGVGRLLVLIQEGCDLQPRDANGKSDPYCEVSMGAQEHKTKVIPATLNPKWNQNMQFTIRDVDQDVLCITVFDRDLFSPNDFLGRTEIRVKEILSESKEKRGPITKRLLLHEISSGEVVVKLDLQLYDNNTQ